MSEAFSKTSVPKLAPGVDATKLRLGPREGFVLSRIDGVSSLGALAVLTGLPFDEVERIVGRLVELRVAYFGARPPWPVEPPRTAPASGASRAAGAAGAAVASGARGVGARFSPVRARPRRWASAELDEPSDLEPDLKAKVLDLHGWLDDMDHYELLGVGRDADRKAIKSAYYALAARFHTDRYFGRSLGSFRAKMEAIFARATIAHDTLATPARRAEYDAQLDGRARAIQRPVADPAPSEEEDEEENTPTAPRSYAEEVMPAAFQTSADEAADPRAPAAASAPSTVAPPARPVSVAPAAPSRPSTPPRAPAERVFERRTPSAPPPAHEGSADELAQQARREAFARRLVGGRGRSEGSVPPPAPDAEPARPTPEEAAAAAEALRRRYQEHRERARHAQARTLIEAARRQLQADDPVGAANNLRLALNYDDDPALRAEYEAVNRRGRDLMADTYLKQARLEEAEKRWAQAAVHYLKVLEGRPDDAQICERAANALRLEGRDLHRAARYAQEAVQKSPSTVEFRVTLGSVYLDAGLFLRARSELEQAAKLAPGDAAITDLLKRARAMSG